MCSRSNMRRLLLVAMLVAAAAGAAQKRNNWSWGADGEDPKPADAAPEESKKRSIGGFGFGEAPGFPGGPAPGPGFGHAPGPAFTHPPGPSHPFVPSPGPHVVHVDGPSPPHGPVEPVVTGHQLRGEDHSLLAGPGDGKSEARFLGIKDKLCEFGLAYDVSIYSTRERERESVCSFYLPSPRSRCHHCIFVYRIGCCCSSDGLRVDGAVVTVVACLVVAWCWWLHSSVETLRISQRGWGQDSSPCVGEESQSGARKMVLPPVRDNKSLSPGAGQSKSARVLSRHHGSPRHPAAVWRETH